MSFINRHFGGLFVLALIGGLLIGMNLAARAITIDLGPLGALAPPTPAPIVPIADAQNGGQALARPTTGTVQTVDGKTITLAGAGPRVIVSDTTSFIKSSAITVADLKAGDEVTALGQQTADGSLAAQSLVVGPALGNGRSAGQSAAGATGAAAGNRSGGGGQGGAALRSVTGTVQTVEGNTVTIATGDGQTVKVTIAAGARLRKSAPATLADVTAGEQITVQGQSGTDGAIAAAVVQIGAQR